MDKQKEDGRTFNADCGVLRCVHNFEKRCHLLWMNIDENGTCRWMTLGEPQKTQPY